MPEEDLYQLALQAGEFSRFALDPHFPPGKFQALYTENGCRKSLNKEIAEEILVIQNEGRIAGMVTLGKKGSQGNIGLIAVSSAFRGQQFGEILIRAAQLWYIQQKLAIARGNHTREKTNRPVSFTTNAITKSTIRISFITSGYSEFLNH